MNISSESFPVPLRRRRAERCLGGGETQEFSSHAASEPRIAILNGAAAPNSSGLPSTLSLARKPQTIRVSSPPPP